jgi:malonyl CoA-acyl carrier protein transacylase
MSQHADPQTSPSPKGLVLCFPGWWGQPLVPLGPAYDSPTLGAAMDRMIELAQQALGIDLKPALTGGEPLEELTTHPAGAQSWLLALQLAHTTLLREHGAAPAAILGHGSGAIAALVACGAWGPSQAFRALRLRLEALKRAQQSAGWPLEAVAISCPAFQRDALLALAGRDLTLARTEAPGRYVLAGLAHAVERTAGGARAFEADARVLQGDGAWNTPWLEPAREIFRAAIEALPCRPPHTPMLSSHSAEPIGAQALDAALLADQLASQLVRPLDLPRTAERLHRGGMRHFVVVGPDQGMRAALIASLGDRPHQVLACQPLRSHGGEGLSRVRAFLEEHGHLRADGPLGLLEPSSKPIPGASLSHLLEGSFLAYLEDQEPAVAALLHEAHHRFLAPAEAPGPQAAATAPAPRAAAPTPAPRAAAPTPAPSAPQQPATHAQPEARDDEELLLPTLSLEDVPDAPPAWAEAPTRDPHTVADTHHQAPPVPKPSVVAVHSPQPTSGRPAPAPRTDHRPGPELPVALLTTGSRPLSREDQERFACQRVLVLSGEGSTGVGDRLRGAGIEVMELAARTITAMPAHTIVQALEGIDTLIYAAHEVTRREHPDADIADVLEAQASLFFRCFQALAPVLDQHPKRVMVPVSQDGNFGAWPRTPVRPLGAFPAAWVRCLQQELPGCSFQLVDGGDLPWPEAIEQRIDWVASQLELGRAPFGMVTPTLVRVGPRGRRDDLLSRGELLLVIDGERGPGFEYALALAGRTNATLLLTGRTPAPTDRPSWLDAAPETLDMVLGQLQHDLVERQRMGPAAAQQQVARARAQWELMRNLDRLREAGISTRYHACDSIDASALVRLAGGRPIRGVIIGPPPMPRKLPEDPGAYLRLTALGTLLGLLPLLDWNQLRVLAACTPLAGWAGSQGQGPLALAGDMLGWFIQALHQRHPQLRGLAFAMGGQGTGSTRSDMFLEALLGSDLPRVAVCDLPTARASGRQLDSFPIAPRPRGRLVLSPEDRAPTVRFERARDLWLDQHRLDDEPALPSAFVAEIFAEIAQARGLGVRDLRFRRPALVRGASLEAEVMDYDGRLLLVPRDRSDLPPKVLPRLAFATCRLGSPQLEEPAGMHFSPRELLALHDAAQEAVLPCYTLLEERFAPTLGLGPIFRGIRSTRHTGDRYMGLISLTDEAMAALSLPGTFAFQPVLADLAMQVAMSWALEEHRRLALPTSLAGLHVLGPSREREAIIVCKARHLSASHITVDLVVREPDLRPVLVLEQLELRAVEGLEDDPESS